MGSGGSETVKACAGVDAGADDLDRLLDDRGEQHGLSAEGDLALRDA